MLLCQPLTRLSEAVDCAVQLVSSWCGVTAEAVNSKNVWSSDVSVWRIGDSPGGFVYVDVSRAVLRTCCSPVQAGISDDNFPRRVQPGIAVVSVSTRGSPENFITPHALANLFHELGHAFHHIIGCTEVLFCCHVFNVKTSHLLITEPLVLQSPLSISHTTFSVPVELCLALLSRSIRNSQPNDGDNDVAARGHSGLGTIRHSCVRLRCNCQPRQNISLNRNNEIAGSFCY
jgi:hypothetical protein